MIRWSVNYLANIWNQSIDTWKGKTCYWHSLWYASGLLPGTNELENKSEIDVTTIPFIQNESKIVGTLQPGSNDVKDIGTSVHGPNDSKDAPDQGPTVRDDEIKMEDHAHPPQGESCFMPITQCMKCLQNHQKCTNRRKHHVNIPRLDLQKVRDAQKLEEDGHMETPASYGGCFGPNKRNVKRKRWIEPDEQISSRSLSSSTVESGTSTREEQNEERDVRKHKALGPIDRSKHTRKNKGSRALLEQARMKLSFCHL